MSGLHFQLSIERERAKDTARMRYLEEEREKREVRERLAVSVLIRHYEHAQVSLLNTLCC